MPCTVSNTSSEFPPVIVTAYLRCGYYHYPYSTDRETEVPKVTHPGSHSERPGSFSWGHAVPGLTRWRGAGWAGAGPPLASVSPPRGIGYSGEEREVRGESQNLDASPHSPQYLGVELKVHSPQWPIWWSCGTSGVWAGPGCERPPTPLWEQGKHRLHTVRRGGSRSLVQTGCWNLVVPTRALLVSGQYLPRSMWWGDLLLSALLSQL